MGWSPKRYECQEREEADTQPLRWARGLLTDTVPPALPGLKSGASRPEQTRPQRDPLLWRAGSSAVPGSNQRPGAFSPRRRDPRCWKTQPCRSQSELSSVFCTSELLPDFPRLNPFPLIAQGAGSFPTFFPSASVALLSFPAP